MTRAKGTRERIQEPAATAEAWASFEEVVESILRIPLAETQREIHQETSQLVKKLGKLEDLKEIVEEHHSASSRAHRVAATEMTKVSSGVAELSRTAVKVLASIQQASEAAGGAAQRLAEAIEGASARSQERSWALSRDVARLLEHLERVSKAVDELAAPIMGAVTQQRVQSDGHHDLLVAEINQLRQDIAESAARHAVDSAKAVDHAEVSHQQQVAALSEQVDRQLSVLTASQKASAQDLAHSIAAMQRAATRNVRAMIGSAIAAVVISVLLAVVVVRSLGL